MTRLSIPNPCATALFGAFFLIANVGDALYAAHGLAPSAGFGLLAYVGFGLCGAYWLHADNRRLGIPEVIDQGWFAYLAWPVMLPYHLFKTRGSRGGWVLVGLVGLFAATYLLSLLVFFAISRGAGPE